MRSSSGAGLGTGGDEPNARPPSLLRTRLLDAASGLYLSADYEDVGIAEIAAAAGVSRRTFYRHFKSGDDLFQTLARAHLAALVTRVRAQVPDADDPVAALIDGYLEWRLRSDALSPQFFRAASLDLELRNERRTALAEAAEVLQKACERSGHPAEPLQALVYRGLLAALEEVAPDIPYPGELPSALLERYKAVIRRLFSPRRRLHGTDARTGPSDDGTRAVGKPY